jgi:hypothetical protein
VNSIKKKHSSVASSDRKVGERGLSQPRWKQAEGAEGAIRRVLGKSNKKQIVEPFGRKN